MASEDKTSRRRTIRDLLVLGLISVLIIVWTGVVFFVIGDRPRDWDYGSHDSVPGESYLSTQPAPREAEPPSQVELPPPAEEPDK
ncbi:MAG: hypothetical protein ACE5JM_16580 [Armatimonadota bacterium]